MDVDLLAIYHRYQYTNSCGDPDGLSSQAKYTLRHLQRRYLELPPLRVVSIVDSIVASSVPISLENTKTTRTRLR